jgi:hypothetical protein
VRLATEATMLARVPSGRRMAARVRVAVVIAFCTIPKTSEALMVELAMGPTSQPSGTDAPFRGGTRKLPPGVEGLKPKGRISELVIDHVIDKGKLESVDVHGARGGHRQ